MNCITISDAVVRCHVSYQVTRCKYYSVCWNIDRRVHVPWQAKRVLIVRHESLQEWFHFHHGSWQGIGMCLSPHQCFYCRHRLWCSEDCLFWVPCTSARLGSGHCRSLQKNMVDASPHAKCWCGFRWGPAITESARQLCVDVVWLCCTWWCVLCIFCQVYQGIVGYRCAKLVLCCVFSMCL